MTEYKQLNLAQFIGTKEYWSLPFHLNFRYTDGVKYLIEEGEFTWIIDIIFGLQSHTEISTLKDFQLWEFKVENNESAILTCKDGERNSVYSQEIFHSETLISEVELYFQRNVLMLPSEY